MCQINLFSRVKVQSRLPLKSGIILLSFGMAAFPERRGRRNKYIRFVHYLLRWPKKELIRRSLCSLIKHAFWERSAVDLRVSLYYLAVPTWIYLCRNRLWEKFNIQCRKCYLIVTPPPLWIRLVLHEFPFDLMFYMSVHMQELCMKRWILYTIELEAFWRKKSCPSMVN